jgi:stalled ribosome rescue protein Dom34
VEKIDYDGEGNKMRIFGTTVGESDNMKQGAHQAMEIHPPKKVTLVKTRFDQVHLDRL